MRLAITMCLLAVTASACSAETTANPSSQPSSPSVGTPGLTATCTALADRGASGQATVSVANQLAEGRWVAAIVEVRTAGQVHVIGIDGWARAGTKTSLVGNFNHPAEHRTWNTSADCQVMALDMIRPPAWSQADRDRLR